MTLHRQFVRHPSGMPIQFEVGNGFPARRDQMRNVSEGGLCFCSRIELEQGVRIHLMIPVLDERFEADGVVVWCHEIGGCGYEIGVRFEQQEAAFGVRMVEQICHIEAYRRQVLGTEGRRLSSEEAASEWIDRFAPAFPAIG